ncbi:hypothetical protein HMPREF9418_1072 [Neisseria macacae ATCC 33926]|uniref:Uncharacterized protein n=1 Tax=Neisseria macacae ATCC 33926 TaxID=997348 RepID=A0AA36XKV8_9NEIS|nr:hypothetical protein HMPREF9418_1072 [Neisseria macacae ATCC 33926]
MFKFFLYKIQQARLFIHRTVFCFSDDLVFVFRLGIIGMIFQKRDWGLRDGEGSSENFMLDKLYQAVPSGFLFRHDNHRGT